MTSGSMKRMLTSIARWFDTESQQGESLGQGRELTGCVSCLS
jgi:hypothetical protein